MKVVLLSISIALFAFVAIVAFYSIVGVQKVGGKSYFPPGYLHMKVQLSEQCLNIIPERATIELINEKYVANVSFYINRYGRNSPYYFNIIGRNKHTWDNNVTINLVFYEYLHNEYRRSFVELHFKLCDMLNSDPYVGAMVANAGITCPVYPGMKYMVNMSIPAADFKYTMPFKRCMAQVYFTITATAEVIVKGNFYVTFSDKKKHI